MKSDYRVRARHFLETIYPLLDGYWHSPNMCRHILNAYNIRHSRNILVGAGVARIAIVTSDYVIKFDYDKSEVERVGGCESEVKFYQFAKQEGFEYMFAEITPFEYMGRTFYIMPRINGIMRKEYCYAEEFFDGVERDFLDYYLNDLHDENYGWFNGSPVIFDYACNRLWIENHNYRSDFYTTTETFSESRLSHCSALHSWGSE